MILRRITAIVLAHSVAAATAVGVMTMIALVAVSPGQVGVVDRSPLAVAATLILTVAAFAGVGFVVAFIAMIPGSVLSLTVALLLLRTELTRFRFYLSCGVVGVVLGFPVTMLTLEAASPQPGRGALSGLAAGDLPVIAPTAAFMAGVAAAMVLWRKQALFAGTGKRDE